MFFGMSFRNAGLLWKIKGGINLGGHMLVSVCVAICAHMKADFLINSHKKKKSGKAKVLHCLCLAILLLFLIIKGIL